MRAAISPSRTFRRGPTRSRCGRKNSAPRRARSQSSRARRSRSISRCQGRDDPASRPNDYEETGETMAVLKRFDTLEVATADVANAVKAYQQNFGFELKPGSTAEGATLKVGGAEIRLVAGAGAAATIALSGEGLAGLWLEAEDIGQVAAALRKAGIEPPVPKADQGRRVLALDPKTANQVALFIFDRKA